MPSVLASVLYYVLLVFFLLLLFRLIMDWVFVFRRDYRATGVVAVALEIAYTVTDPPLKALRRVIPPLRFGNFGFDVGFLILVIVVQILMSQVAAYR